MVATVLGGQLPPKGGEAAWKVETGGVRKRTVGVFGMAAKMSQRPV